MFSQLVSSYSGFPGKFARITYAHPEILCQGRELLCEHLLIRPQDLLLLTEVMKLLELLYS